MLKIFTIFLNIIINYKPTMLITNINMTSASRASKRPVQLRIFAYSSHGTGYMNWSGYSSKQRKSINRHGNSQISKKYIKIKCKLNSAIPVLGRHCDRTDHRSNIIISIWWGSDWRHDTRDTTTIWLRRSVGSVRASHQVVCF